MILTAAAGCGKVNCPEASEYDGRRCVRIDAGVDAALDSGAGGDGGDLADASLDAGTDAGDRDDSGARDAGPPDAGVPDAGLGDAGCDVTCYRDMDGDGFGDETESELACSCGDGWAPGPVFDCADDNADAFPGQDMYFDSPFIMRRGSLSINSWDYNCDEVIEKMDPAPCYLGLAGSCPDGAEGPGAYDSSSVICGNAVDWIRCHADCAYDDLGTMPLPCR